MAVTDKPAHADITEQADAPRLLTRAEVLKRIPVTYPTLWSLMRRTEDPFPRAIRVGARVMWVEAELNAWIAKQARQKLKGD
jgi:predicted DNA-binding transcriptional regulator AlpA